MGEAEAFHVSEEVAILGISLFVEGLGWGPMLLGPLSEFYGRNAIYWTSYTIYWTLSWPVAFAPNAGARSTVGHPSQKFLVLIAARCRIVFSGVFLAFRFLCGFAGSAFLSVAGGSVSDLWVSTFHACCVRILRRDIEKLGYSRNFEIFDTSDQQMLIKDSTLKSTPSAIQPAKFRFAGASGRISSALTGSRGSGR